MHPNENILMFLNTVEIIQLSGVNSDWRTFIKTHKHIPKSIWRGGIPSTHRKAYWDSVLSPNHSLYDSLQEEVESSDLEHTKDEILRDLPRTYIVNKDPEKSDQLLKMLLAGAVALKDIGYCQGLNFILGVFLEISGQSVGFAQYIAMIDKFGMSGLFVPGLPDLPLREFQMNHYIQKYLPVLFKHFKENSVTTGFFISRWFMTIFAVYLPFETLLRVWDCFFQSGWKTIYKIGLAILTEVQDTLLELDLGGISIYIRDSIRSNHGDFSALLNVASKIRVTSRELQELEELYYIHKAGEKIEQMGETDGIQVLVEAKLKVKKYENPVMHDIQYYKVVLEDIEKKIHVSMKDYIRLHPQVTELERRIETLCDSKVKYSDYLNQTASEQTDQEVVVLSEKVNKFPMITCVLLKPQPSSYSRIKLDPSVCRETLAKINRELKWLQQRHYQIYSEYSTITSNLQRLLSTKENYTEKFRGYIDMFHAQKNHILLETGRKLQSFG